MSHLHAAATYTAQSLGYPSYPPPPAYAFTYPPPRLLPCITLAYLGVLASDIRFQRRTFRPASRRCLHYSRYAFFLWSVPSANPGTPVPFLDHWQQCLAIVYLGLPGKPRYPPLTSPVRYHVGNLHPRPPLPSYAKASHAGVRP